MIEEEDHLFCMYGFAASIWCHIFKLVGIGVILLRNIITLSDYLYSSSSNFKHRKRFNVNLANSGLENLGGEQLYYLFRLESNDFGNN